MSFVFGKLLRAQSYPTLVKRYHYISRIVILEDLEEHGEEAIDSIGKNPLLGAQER